MGILDDAIREHLELKRQHGAPEDEVQRQQDEALGPARRDVAPPAEDGERTVAAEGEPEGTQLDEAASELDEAAPGEAAEPVEAGERELLEADEPEAVEGPTRSRSSPSRSRPSRSSPPSRSRPVTTRPRAALSPHRGSRPQSRSSPRPTTRLAAMSRSPTRTPNATRTTMRTTRRATCSRTPPTSSRRPQSTTGSGSSKSHRAISTSTNAWATRRPCPSDGGSREPSSCGGGRPPRRPPHYATQRRPVPLDSTEPSMPSVDDFSTGTGKTLKVRARGSTGVVGQRWGTHSTCP